MFYSNMSIILGQVTFEGDIPLDKMHKKLSRALGLPSGVSWLDAYDRGQWKYKVEMRRGLSSDVVFTKRGRIG